MHHKRQIKIKRAVADALDFLAARKKQEIVGRVVDRLLHLSLYCFELSSRFSGAGGLWRSPLACECESPAGLPRLLHKKIKGASAVKLPRPLLIEP
jgi:hypothetical protein